jgi:hypothetical protein
MHPLNSVSKWRGFSLGQTYDCGPVYRKCCTACGSSLSIPETRYPTLYCIVIIPFSAFRWTCFGQTAKNPGSGHCRPAGTLIALTIFNLSGVFNALLYAITRSDVFERRIEIIRGPSMIPLRVVREPHQENMG